MPDTNTLNYGWVKPEINGSPNTWGNKLNTDLDQIDATMKGVDDKADAAVPKTGWVTDDDLIDGPLRYDPAVVTTNDRDIPYVGLLKAWIQNASPRGEIKMWGGTIASIPSGYALCDGSTVNTYLTPDLRDRFIIGAGNAPYKAPGAFGGSDIHNHGGATGGTALNESHLPSHVHGVNDPGHTHGIGDPGHAHSYNDRSLAANGGFGYGGSIGSSPSDGFEGRTTSVSGTGIWIGGAGTGIWLSATGGNQAHNHSIATANHMPPYYALAFIMRVKYPWEP